VSADYPGDGDWQAEEKGGQSLAQVAFLLDPLGVVKRRWIWMLVVMLLGLSASVATYELWTPVYVSEGRLLITSQQIPQDFVRSTVRDDSIANISAMIGEVLSTQNLGRILDEIRVFPESEGTHTRMDLVARMRNSLEISPRSGGSTRDASLIYGVSFTHTEAKTAAAVANAVAALFVEASISRRNKQARQTTLFLRRELERDEAELRDQARLVTEFRRAHRGTLPEELQVSLKKLDFLYQKREETVTNIGDLEAQLASLRSGDGLGLSRSEAQLEELRHQLAEQTAVHTDEHPNVTAIRRRVEQLEAAVAAEALDGRSLPAQLRERMQADERQLSRLRAQLLKLDADSRELSARVDGTPQVAEELKSLIEKEGVLREDYLDSLRKVEAAERAESLEASHHAAQASILDPAREPRDPKIPAWFILVGGVAATLALSLGCGVLMELLDPVIVSAEQLDQIAERPVLGALPRMS